MQLHVIKKPQDRFTLSFLAEASIPEMFNALASAYEEADAEKGLAGPEFVKNEAEASDDDRGKPRKKRERKELTRQTTPDSACPLNYINKPSKHELWDDWLCFRKSSCEPQKLAWTGCAHPSLGERTSKSLTGCVLSGVKAKTKRRWPRCSRKRTLARSGR